MSAPPSTTPLDSERGRRLFSHWATGVSVLTSQVEGRPRGCTANAVASLSLEPLLLLVCFAQGSNTLEAVRVSGRFALNVLASDQEPLARHFAGKGAAEGKFGGVDHVTVGGLPILGGCLAWLACDVEEELPGGDHAIVIGRPGRGEAREDARPLLFFRSRYGPP